MQRMMRKYRNYILGFILMFIGFPMLFFGVPGFLGSQSQNADQVIATVGGEEIFESAFRRNLGFAASRYSQDQPLSFAELAQAGYVDSVMREMEDSALINIGQKKRDFSITDNTAAELMKTWPDFQDKEGNFDVNLFNTWRERQVKAGLNWNDLYEELRTSLDRQVYMNLALAPSNRITDKEVEQELNNRFQQLKLRYTKIEPPVYITNDEIEAYYAEHQENYKNPDQQYAQYIAVPIATARPSKADDVFQKLEEGEDFATLADTYSDQQIKNGGDLGWQFPLEVEEPHRIPLFELAVGEVSDLINSPQGYFIYKVEDERINEESGLREVKARQIFLLKPDMSEDERLAQSNKMAEIVNIANQKSIGEAAEQFQLSVEVTGNFDISSVEIENVPRADAVEFREKLQNTTPDNPYVLIVGRENNYCAKITEVVEGEVKPLEEVREQVIQDAKQQYKQEEEYRNRTKAYAYRLGRELTKLDDIKTIYPNMKVTINATLPFSQTDNLFAQGVQLNTREVFEAFKGKEQGDIVGPMVNFIGDYYFLELDILIPFSDVQMENIEMEEEKKNTRNFLMAQNQAFYMQDYRKYLRDSMLPNLILQWDDARVADILGVIEPDLLPIDNTDAGVTVDLPQNGLDIPGLKVEGSGSN